MFYVLSFRAKSTNLLFAAIICQAGAPVLASFAKSGKNRASTV